MAERLLIEARNRAVAIADGVIEEPSGHFDRVLRFPDADVRPGLINAHDHLHRNHYGRLGSPPYPDAYAWAQDIQRRCAREIQGGARVPRRRALEIGALKNLFAGVTTVVHHDRWEPDFEHDFPLRVVRIPSADSLGMTPELPGIDPTKRFALHLAEGRSPLTVDEVPRLGERGLLGPNLIAVHGVGMEGDAIAAFRASGAALVWCPSSNIFLFGHTAPVELLRDGVDVLLGSDSLLTGAGDLLDELKTARTTGLLSDARLESAVGDIAARRLGLAAPSLAPGSRADVIVLTRPVLEASAHDVQLVVAGGTVRVAAAGLAPRLGPGRIVDHGGVKRWIAEPRAASDQAVNRSASSRPLPHYELTALERDVRA